MGKNKQKDLQKFALVRDYLLDVVASAVAAGIRDQEVPPKVLERLAAKEAKLVEALDE